MIERRGGSIPAVINLNRFDFDSLRLCVGVVGAGILSAVADGFGISLAAVNVRRSLVVAMRRATVRMTRQNYRAARYAYRLNRQAMRICDSVRLAETSMWGWHSEADAGGGRPLSCKVRRAVASVMP